MSQEQLLCRRTTSCLSFKQQFPLDWAMISGFLINRQKRATTASDSLTSCIEDIIVEFVAIFSVRSARLNGRWSQLG